MRSVQRQLQHGSYASSLSGTSLGKTEAPTFEHICACACPEFQQSSLNVSVHACRFDMLPMEGGKLGDYMNGPLDTQFGTMYMQAAPPLVKEDFYQQYQQPTFWPYCESLERCVVYRCV